MGTYEFMCVYMCVYVHAEDRGEVRCLILSLSTSVFEIEFLTKPKLAFLARLVGYQALGVPPSLPSSVGITTTTHRFYGYLNLGSNGYIACILPTAPSPQPQNISFLTPKSTATIFLLGGNPVPISRRTWIPCPYRVQIPIHQHRANIINVSKLCPPAV